MRSGFVTQDLILGGVFAQFGEEVGAEPLELLAECQEFGIGPDFHFSGKCGESRKAGRGGYEITS
jgi:hypothetical protein